MSAEYLAAIDKIGQLTKEKKALQAEIHDLRRGIKAALNHIVSYEFVEMYKKDVDKEQTEQWVPAVYVKEITSFVTEGKTP